MNDVDEFIKYVNNFLKRPIFPKQEAAILCAMIDGTINKNTAKELYAWVMEENIKNHNALMEMSLEEILELCDKYGIDYNKNVDIIL